MKTKINYLKALVNSFAFILVSIFILSCDSSQKAENEYMVTVADTVSVSDVLSDEKVLLEFGYDKTDILSSFGFDSYLVPAGTEIRARVDHDANKRFVTVTKNDFVVLKNDISFLHPKIKGLDNLLIEYNSNHLKEIQFYKVYNFGYWMSARKTDELIEFAELTVFEVGDHKKRTIPYLIENLEEWKQERDNGTIKDNDPVFFERNMANKFYSKTLDWKENFIYKKSTSFVPFCYITKEGKLIALIGQDGKLWRTRAESKMIREKNSK